MQNELVIKIAILGFESRFIRLQERKQIRQRRKILSPLTWWKHNKKHSKGVARREKVEKKVPEGNEEYAKEAYDRFWNLHHHRQKQVRTAARHSLVALGFLRDRAFKDIEQGSYSQPDWKEVEKIAHRHFEGDDFFQTFGAWLANAKQYYEEHGNLNVTV